MTKPAAPRTITLDDIDAILDAFDAIEMEPDSLLIARDPTDGVVKMMTAAEFGEKHSRGDGAK